MIKKVLDLALKARDQGRVFNPIFDGDAGLGKSQIAQEWVEDQRKLDSNFGFIDLRIAYYEAPDMVGFPKEIPDDRAPDGFKTIHCLPDLWPLDKDSRGLILLEEPNRGTVGVMNCLMQLLTDRKIKNYTLPKGWIVAACINPDTSEYAVNAMDAALKDRFEPYEVTYDHNSFVEYLETHKWNQDVANFIKSGAWIYKSTKELAKDARYISPRTLSKLDASMQAGLKDDRALHFITSQSILGKDMGKAFHKFCYDESPVSYDDLLKNKPAALKKLKQQSDPGSYKGEMIQITVDSIAEHFTAQEEDDTEKQLVGEKTMAEVAEIIPSDQAINLLRECARVGAKDDMANYFNSFIKKYPKLIGALKASLAQDRAQNANK